MTPTHELISTRNMNGKIYLRKCLICKERFKPLQNGQVVCDYQCSLLYAGKVRQKASNAKKRVMLDRLKTKSVHLREAQIVFNTFIRLRDMGKKCISCDCELTGKYDAGHFFSVGAYPNMRFNEDNTHGQCVSCNQHQHGNLIEYGIRIIDRIGAERYGKLTEARNVKPQYSIPEILELKTLYKNKIKNLKTVVISNKEAL